MTNYEVKTKEVNGEKLYSTDQPERKGQRLFPLGYFRSEEEAREARERHNEATKVK